MITGAWRAGNEDGRPGWRLTFGGAGFSTEKIEALKSRVPWRDRGFDPKPHPPEWWVAREREETLVEIFPEFDAYRRQLQLL